MKTTKSRESGWRSTLALSRDGQIKILQQNLCKSQGKKKNMLIDWPRPHLPNTWLSIIKYYPSPTTPLPLRNSKYKWYQQVLVGGLLSPPTLRIGHFRRTITRPEGWKFGHRTMCWWERFLPTIPKMFDPQQSKLHHEGSPWKGVWKPLEGAIVGPQVCTTRVYWPTMQMMPNPT